MLNSSIKGFVAGVASAAFVMGSITAFAAGKTNIQAILNEDIKIIYHGEEAVLKDVNGNRVYPISYQGTTYVPVRGISQLYGESVGWEQDSQSVIIGSKENAPSSGDIYVFGEPVPFSFPAFSYTRDVLGTKYHDTVISDLKVTKAVLNDKGQYVLSVTVSGHVEDVGAYVIPKIEVKIEYLDAYGSVVDSQKKEISASKDGKETSGEITFTAPQKAVKMRVVTDAVQ